MSAVLMRVAAGFLAAWLAGWIFLEIAEELLNPFLRLADRLLLLAVVHDRTPFLTQVMWVLTWTGSSVSAVLVTAASVGFLLRRRRSIEALALIVTLTGTGLLIGLLKNTYQRPRPDISPLVTEPTYSFPSGHTITAVALYGFLAYLISRHIEHPGWKFATWLTYILLAGAIAYSRVYLGAHWPSDVLAGIFAGLVWLTTMILALILIEHRDQSRRH